MPTPYRSLLLTLFCLIAAGCGLGDYESRMDAERARVKLYDEENRLLGELVEQPSEKVRDREAGGDVDRPVWPFVVCLRLPQGIAGMDSGRFQGVPTVPVFRYPGKDGYNVFVAAGMLVERNKENVYRPGEWPAEDFRQGVRAGVREYYKKIYDFIPLKLLKDQAVKDIKARTSWRSEDLPPLEFERYDGNDNDNKNLKDNSNFDLYIHRQGNRQVAIAVQVPQSLAKEKQTTDAIDLCLKSLDISEQAGDRRIDITNLVNRRQGPR